MNSATEEQISNIEQGMSNFQGRIQKERRGREQTLTANKREGKNGRKAFDLEERLVAFSVRITDAVEALPGTRLGNHVAG
jgi:hypothetical protein